MTCKTWRGFSLMTLLGLSLLGVGGSGCSSVDDSGAFQDGSGTDGSGWDSASASASASDGASGYPGDTGGADPSGGGTSGAGDDGMGEPDPEEEEPAGTSTGEMACDDQTPVELYLSPDDSNSMSSPVQAREAMQDWGSLSGVPLRTWEFLNYYTFDYPPAEPGDLTVTPSLYRDESMPEGEYLLQIGVASEEVANEERAPLNITLVLDTSGSMSGTPMDMLKESCRAIAAQLREGDKISMVTWDTSNAVVLGGYQVSGPDDVMLLSKIDNLSAGGGTDLHGGLTAGYGLAQDVYDSSRINRIVLISDGGANVGITDEELIAEHAGANDADGIYMVGVGVGDAGYNDLLMDTVTDVGKGASVFIASEAEAWKIFGDRFVNTLAVAARDVQVRLDLPPGFEIVRFSGEEYSSDPKEVEPQHIAPNDAMVFHQRIATCAPELIDESTALTVTVRFKDAITFEEREVTTELGFTELLAGDQSQLFKGAAIFEYAEALKAYRDEGDMGAIEAALAQVSAALELLPGDIDLLEIQGVLEAL